MVSMKKVQKLKQRHGATEKAGVPKGQNGIDGVLVQAEMIGERSSGAEAIGRNGNTQYCDWLIS